MGILRKLLLPLLVLGMFAAIVLTWGSIGSVILTFCLLLMGASVVYQRFLTNRDEGDFDWE